MLERLQVQDYALIERAGLVFAPGLNVLTGETGAGKSILVGALGMLLGHRTAPDAVRTGADEAVVAGTVRVAGHEEALAWLAHRSIAPEDGAVILRRTVKIGGRGSAFVQSMPVTRAELAEIAGLLFDLHGQHEHQSLLQADVHRSYVDRFGGLEDRVVAFGELFRRLAELRDRLSRLVKDERERIRELDLLEHSAREIAEAALRPGEERELEQERNILVHAEQLNGLLERAYESVAEARGGAAASLRQARKALDEASGIDPTLGAAARAVESSFYEIEDVAERVREHRDRIAFDTARLEEVEQRLAAIRTLERKYGDTVEDVITYGEKCRSELESLRNGEVERGALEAEASGLERELVRSAEALSGSRTQAAAILERRIEAELKGLGMAKTRFSVSVALREGAEGKAVYGPHGRDAVEFLISPNPGEPFKRLATIASGGEISRVMLAIKAVLADQDSIGSLIFDEVDVGIGGEVALAVGTKLQELARRKQVLCVTHLATIAARAGNHLTVQKVVRDGRTMTEVRAVEAGERVEELARMLAGDRSSGVSLDHARELLARYGPGGTDDRAGTGGA